MPSSKAACLHLQLRACLNANLNGRKRCNCTCDDFANRSHNEAGRLPRFEAEWLLQQARVILAACSIAALLSELAKYGLAACQATACWPGHAAVACHPKSTTGAHCQGNRHLLIWNMKQPTC